jgi:DNA mismatch repair protein MutS
MRIDVGGGMEVVADAFGDPAGEPVVFLHGGGQTRHAWGGTARELAEKNRSLALFATHYFELTALPAEIDGCANLHFDAVEHADGIVFLHAAEDGPANRSYGLQVAKLAGVPSAVVRRAKDYLARLDKVRITADQAVIADVNSTRPRAAGRAGPADLARHTRSPERQLARQFPGRLVGNGSGKQ